MRVRTCSTASEYGFGSARQASRFARVIADLAARASSGRRLAIDTEFVSERRYRALLCLVQVAVPDPDGPDGVRTEVIDPLADGFDPASTAPLAEVLADPDVEVVVHAGRQDVAILRRAWQTEIRNVFDTQVAGGLPRARQPGGLRVARPQGARDAAEGLRGLHALGPAPAHGAAARVRGGRRSLPAHARASGSRSG